MWGVPKTRRFKGDGFPFPLPLGFLLPIGGFRRTRLLTSDVSCRLASSSVSRRILPLPSTSTIRSFEVRGVEDRKDSNRFRFFVSFSVRGESLGGGTGGMVSEQEW